MTPRRQDNYRGEERRQGYRRDEDVADHEVAQRVMRDTSTANRVVHASKKISTIGGAALLLGVMIGGIAASLGIRVVGPSDAQAQITKQVNTNTARLDSVVNVLRDVTYNLRVDAYARCLQSHRDISGECKP